MSKSKILRCEAPGCRTLTRGGRCDLHRGPGQAIKPSPQTTAADRTEGVNHVVNPPIETSRARLAGIQAGLEAALAWERRVDHLDLLRANLRSLRECGERIERSTEQPVFSESEGANYGI